MSDITRMMSQLEQGDKQAASSLLPLVYDELRKLAAQKLDHEQPGQLLQPTALVHEAYLRLIGPANADGFANRRHFFAAAAESMRRILIEQARVHRPTRSYLNLDDLALKHSPDPETLLAVHEVLGRLESNDPEVAELIKLRFFTGMSMPEAAQALGQPLRTVERWWTYARSWLHTQLKNSR